MVPRPVALGLTLCDQVIVEVGTNKVSLIGGLAGIKTKGFPAVPLPFCVFASLTDGLGDGTIELTVTQVETDEEIYPLQRGCAVNLPQPEPRKDHEVVTESPGSLLVVVEGPADTTRRPRRPNIPLSWPRETPPPKPASDGP